MGHRTFNFDKNGNLLVGTRNRVANAQKPSRKPISLAGGEQFDPVTRASTDELRRELEEARAANARLQDQMQAIVRDRDRIADAYQNLLKRVG